VSGSTEQHIDSSPRLVTPFLQISYRLFVYLQIVKIHDHKYRKGYVRKMTWKKLVKNYDLFFFISYSLVSSMVFVRIVYATCSARSIVQLR